METNRLLFGYYLPTAVFPSLLVFILLKQYSVKFDRRFLEIIPKISSLSLGVYLLHKFIMALELRALNYFGIQECSLVWIICMPFVTWLICLFCVYVIKKNKYSIYIFP